jgi:glutamine synthetase
MTQAPPDIHWLRLGFVDVFGIANEIQIPATRLAEAIKRGVPFDGSALEGPARYLEADMLLRPDPATLVPVGEGIARVTCTVHTPDGSRWAADPRLALEQVLTEAGEFGETLTVAAELEFYLLDGNDQPVDTAGYYDVVEGAASAVVREFATQLIERGVEIEGWHHEAGRGQYEIDLAPLPPMALADALVFAKHLVHDHARRAGWRATFMARPFADQPGSGMHLHQRIPGSGRGELEAADRAFIAGQLAHARALSALAAPTVNSYKRLHTGPEAPGAIVWANQNRGALLRVSSYRDASASIEFRGADASANPYLLIAGLIAAGLDGLDRDLELPPAAEESTIGYDGGPLELRIEPLPRNLDDALDALLADDVIVDCFNPQLLARLVDGRRAEALAYRSLVTDWERDTYLDA